MKIIEILGGKRRTRTSRKRMKKRWRKIRAHTRVLPSQASRWWTTLLVQTRAQEFAPGEGFHVIT